MTAGQLLARMPVRGDPASEGPGGDAPSRTDGAGQSDVVGSEQTTHLGIVLTPAQWQDATTRANAQRLDGDFRLLWGALASGFVTEAAVADAIAVHTQCARYTHAILPTSGPMPEARELLKLDVQQSSGVAPFAYVDQRLRVAVDDPTTRLAGRALAELTTHSVELFIASRAELATITKRAGQQSRALIDFAGARAEVANDELETGSDELSDRASESVVVETVDRILAEAVSLNASDIHFEPQDNGLRIEARVDGTLRELLVIGPHASATASLSPREAIRLRDRILGRIVNGLGKAPFEEARHRPIDGRFTWETGAGRRVDVRLAAGGVGGATSSVFVVLRLLGANDAPTEIDHIGLEPAQLQAVLIGLRYTHGYVLLSGPTGSGKSTSAHAMLGFVKSPTKKCISIEKPVEWIQPGVRQLEVTEEGEASSKNTWLGLLRLALRGDPDVIYCGEINDTLTAKAAMSAADTGHLMISTVHANTAVETMGRLRELGVSLQTMAHQGRLVIAQRLVSHLCPFCSGLATADDRGHARQVLQNHGYAPNLSWRDVGLTDRDLVEAMSVQGQRGITKDRPDAPPPLDAPIVAWAGLTTARGCAGCHGRGSSGRIAVFSVVGVRDAFKAALLQEHYAELPRIAYEQGTRSLLAAACCRVLRGETALADAVMSLGPGFGPHTL